MDRKTHALHKRAFEGALKHGNSEAAEFHLRHMGYYNEDLIEFVARTAVPRGLGEIEQFLRDVSHAG